MRYWIALTLITTGLLQTPAITAVWQGDNLVVSATPGSLYLVGGGLADQFIDRQGATSVELPMGGVDQGFAPQLRDALVLKNTNGEVIATLPIPLKPDRYKVILPIVAHTLP